MTDIAVHTTHVRPARFDDAPAVRELLIAMGGHDELRANDVLATFAALLTSPDARVIVAERAGAVAGVALLHVRLSLLTDRREAWLGALAVAPALRSSGIGSELLAAADREAAALGCSAIVLETSTMRERTHAFYEAHGFARERPAVRFARPVLAQAETLVDHFLAASARAAGAVALAIAGRAGDAAVGLGADGAPTEAADDAAEHAALTELLPLGVPIVSEEAGLVGAASLDPDHPWISLDPLDGSRNFVAGNPAYAISIGLVQGGRALAGVVVELASGRRWVAQRGGGATLNGRPIRTRRSAIGAIPSPVPHTAGRCDLPGIKRVRISGSTASDLCRVADGSFAVFFGLDRSVVHVHDLAAAIVVIEEAGGCVIDRSGAVPVLVPDPAVCFDIVAACDEPFARTLASL
jgi:fructose-1,6-bisphosphatase/inositol monophosphatase family enzyme/GNAT superfamily N-acetyltransferase